MLDRLGLALAGRGVRPVEILARFAVPKGDRELRPAATFKEGEGALRDK